MERVKSLTVLLCMSMYGSRQPSQSRLGVFLSRATCAAKHVGDKQLQRLSPKAHIAVVVTDMMDSLSALPSVGVEGISGWDGSVADQGASNASEVKAGKFNFNTFKVERLALLRECCRAFLPHRSRGKP
ncbi:hypothetical protein KCU79_g108, partial [Aureobasidium melanogenum]